MHLSSSEVVVSSTTNSTITQLDTNEMPMCTNVSSDGEGGGSGNSVNNNNITTNSGDNTSNSNTNNRNSMGLLTAETLAERTLEGLMAEHPGELVRTGCPHVVSFKIK